MVIIRMKQKRKKKRYLPPPHVQCKGEAIKLLKKEKKNPLPHANMRRWGNQAVVAAIVNVV